MKRKGRAAFFGTKVRGERLLADVSQGVKLKALRNLEIPPNNFGGYFVWSRSSDHLEDVSAPVGLRAAEEFVAAWNGTLGRPRSALTRMKIRFCNAEKQLH